MWPGFNSRSRRHMWVEFVVGSRPCSERFFSGYSGFPLSSKTNISKFQFDLESEGHKFISLGLLRATLVKQRLFIYLFFFTLILHSLIVHSRFSHCSVMLQLAQARKYNPLRILIASSLHVQLLVIKYALQRKPTSYNCTYFKTFTIMNVSVQ